MKINDIMKKYKLSARSIAILVDVTPATVNYWQKNHNGVIPAKFLDRTQSALGTIDKIAEISNVNFSEICPLVIEFKKSPFWRNWAHLKYLLLQSLPAKNEGSSSFLIKEIEKYIEKTEGNLKEYDNPRKETAKLVPMLDIALGNDEGNLVGFFIFNNTITLKGILKELSVIEEIHSELPESKYYFFASKVENSILLATEDDKYVNFVEFKTGKNTQFKKVQ
jgi:hypothetical protein